MSNNIDFIDNEIPSHKKKSKKKGLRRAKHKHEYETVLLTTKYKFTDLKTGQLREYKSALPTRVCMICGRIDYVDQDPSYYIERQVDGIPFFVYDNHLSGKAWGLPKWSAESFDKFATKMED